MNAIFHSLFTAILEFLAKLAAGSRKAQDADRDPVVLKRGAHRIREWLRKNGASTRIKHDQGGPKLPD